MNRTRSTALAASIALALGLGFVLAPEASADPAPTALSVQERSEWACVAVETVNVGACIENPLPDPTDYGTVPGIIQDVVGTVLPG